MEHSIGYKFMMSSLMHIEDIKENEKTKISRVFDQTNKRSCILRVCKNRDLSDLCEILKNTRSKNLVVIYNYIYENGDTYILEEDISGSTLEEIIEEKGVFSEAETARIIIDVCNGLAELHGKRPPVVHNDIKTANIMIREDKSVKLFDFDISRVYKVGRGQNTQLLGTQEYASPEHFGYGQSEPRTDIYCLGVTMHKMLTGRGISNDHKSTYNGKLNKIINKCLEIDPKNRYSSVSMLKKDLEKYFSGRKRGIGCFLGILAVAAVVAFTVWCMDLLDYAESLGVLDTTDVGYELSEEKDSTEVLQQSEDTTEVKDEETDVVEIAGQDSENSGAISVPEDMLPEQSENHSREDAFPVSLEQEYTDSIDGEDINDWYCFTTTENWSVYRFSVYPDIEDKSDSGYIYIYLTVYDNKGIKVSEELRVHRDDTVGFLDMSLDPETDYNIKIYAFTCSGSQTGYKLCVSEIACDAGIDEYTAAQIEVGMEYTAVMNSTFSDWYTFTVPEDGQYVLNLHNIDVGYYLSFVVKKGNVDSNINSGTAQNEDSGYCRFSGKKGEKLYVEVYAIDEEADGSYIMSIEKYR